MEKPCENCGSMFHFKPSHADRARFCSRRCLGVANGRRATATGTNFQKGMTPWSKLHAKGIHLSPGSEFKKGARPTNHLPVGSVTIRMDKSGKPRAFVKTAEPNVWRLRAVIAWESIHGPLAKGLLVHHRDRDSLNDDPVNLQALTRAEHLLEHREENEPLRMAGFRRSHPNRTA